jgi:ADP-ribosylglycohydrolase
VKESGIVENSRLYDKVLGCLMGGEIGDAMGAPAENKSYQQIIKEYGQISDWSGSGTDDSALKHILIDAIERSGGYPTADTWAAEWLRQEHLFIERHLFWTPVMNGFWRIRAEGCAPREAGSGNMASSSSAMCISPMGIINAGDPRQAALETWEVASPIHHNFARDAACSMAAAVAAGFHPDATVQSVLEAAIDVLPPTSGATMRRFISTTLALAKESEIYETFRERFYGDRLLPGIAMPDARETVPVALALFSLAKGAPREGILYGANFGRDADTIASMVGALAGAFRGASDLPTEWVEKLQTDSPRDHRGAARNLVSLIHKRAEDQRARIEALEQLS